MKKLTQPIQNFLKHEASSGIILAAMTVLAMMIANSELKDIYFEILHAKLFGLSIHHWINDALMAIFFFVVGMEIKRELIDGELSSTKKAMLPILAALGGVIAPALIYYSLNPNYPEARGWGIPMATDIAFAVGVLSLFGKRIPLSLKIFLLALAIVDDLMAVVVIALFYTKEISSQFLLYAVLLLGIAQVCKKMGVKSYAVYSAIGVCVWYAMLKSGVHATIAGVLLGLLTPLKFPNSRHNKNDFYSPLNYLVQKLHPLVSYFIMPVFALANAGVNISGVDFSHIFDNSIYKGVSLGLILGKPTGIFLFSFFAVKLGVAQLPKLVNWRLILGTGCLGGIGFTMALFVSGLALYPEQEVYSKIGILLGSSISALIGSLILTKQKKSV